MRFTRARDLLVAGLVSLAVGYLLCQLSYADLPSLPTLAGLPLLLLAVVEGAVGVLLRDKIRQTFEGKPVEGRPLQPLTVARAVALAKASSLLGAIMLGVWLGVLGYLMQNLHLRAAGDDLPSSIVGAGCSVALLAAGLWLEHCCRTPGAQADHDRERQTDQP